jgi:site-specific DNA recombinase
VSTSSPLALSNDERMGAAPQALTIMNVPLALICGDFLDGSPQIRKTPALDPSPIRVVPVLDRLLSELAWITCQQEVYHQSIVRRARLGSQVAACYGSVMRAVIYLRISDDRDGTGLAVDRQREACRQLCAARGWTVTDEYVDNSVSATNGVRPEWTRLIADARTGHCDVIVTWAVDRLVRLIRDLDTLLDAGVKIATVQGDLDLTTPQGELVGTILAAVARNEVRQKSARQVAANFQRARNGSMPWTRRPFGYRLDPDSGKIVADRAELWTVRYAANLFLSGETLASIARRLDRWGMPTATGGTWSVTTLRRVLANPRHTGRVAYHGEILDVTAPWDATFDLDTHRAIVVRLSEPDRRKQAGTEPRYLLSGLAVCWVCSARMFSRPMTKNGRRWHAYACRDHHNTALSGPIDEHVTQLVLARLSQPEALAVLTAANAPEQDAHALAVRAGELRGYLDDLATLLADGSLTADGVKRESARLNAELAEVEQRRARLAGDPVLATLAGAEDVGVAWEALPLRRQRAVVDLLMTVTVRPGGRGHHLTAGNVHERVAVVWRAGLVSET